MLLYYVCMDVYRDSNGFLVGVPHMILIYSVSIIQRIHTKPVYAV